MQVFLTLVEAVPRRRARRAMLLRFNTFKNKRFDLTRRDPTHRSISRNSIHDNSQLQFVEFVRDFTA